MKWNHLVLGISVNQIEIELTSRCNASCPQCVRNDYGGSTWPSLPLVDIDLGTLIKSLAPIADQLEHIRLCGTYGDPCVYKKLIGLIDWLHQHSSCKITINTNASMHTPAWWTRLAQKLNDQDKVYFGIDGLEDTHHLHRKGTNFKKIIENLRAFNQAGGHSVWSFIVFEHNQHQIETAQALSQQLGCKQFAWKSTSRFVNKAHKLIEKSPVKNRVGEIIYWLRPASDIRYVNHGYNSFADLPKKYGSFENYVKSATISCMAKNSGSVYISAEGYLLPCGFLHDRFYGAESEQHTDRQKLFEMIQLAGGLDAVNIKNHAIIDIVQNSFFTEIENSWDRPDKLERCANQCGNESNLVYNANRELAKIWSGENQLKEK